MSWHRAASLAGLLSTLLASPIGAAEFGRPATPAEIALWDIDVRPDGTGLPAGSGGASQGAVIFSENCAGCHGAGGEGGIGGPLVGGMGSLASDHPVKTVGSFWPYATTLFDYVRRAMPYPAPGTLSNDEAYAVTAYVLALNGIVASDAVLDRKTLPRVLMPNRDGFVPDHEFGRYGSRR
jgi:mono/diheme cytochrome c family protein